MTPPSDVPSPSNPTPWRAFRRLVLRVTVEGLLALGGSVAAIFACYPLFPRLLRTHIWVRITDIYAAGDFGGTLFLLGRALLGESGRSSTLLSYPEGFAFKGVFYNEIFTRLMAPFVALLGMPTGWNVATLVTLASNGAAVHLASRVVGARFVPSVCAGMIGAVTPMVMEEVASGRNVTAWWAPVVAGYALCLAAIPSWRRLPLAIPGIALLALALANYGYALVLMAPLIALAGLGALFPWSRGRLLRALLVVGIGLAVLIPFSRPFVEAGSATLSIRPNYWQQSLSIPRLFSFHADPQLFMRVPGPLIPLLVLGAMVGLKGFRGWLPPLLGAAGLLTVSLGANLWETSETAQIYLHTPFVWVFERFTFLWGCPRPLRYGVVGAFVLALAWGPAWSAATAWTHRAWLRDFLALLAFLPVILFVPVKADRSGYLAWPVMPAMDLMRDQPVLLDLPLAFRTDTTAMQMVGYVGVPRLNPPGQDFIEWRARLDLRERPLLTAVAVIEDGFSPSEALIERLRGEIPEQRTWGLRRVVVHRRAATEVQIGGWSRLFEALGATRLHDDAILTVWELPAPREAPGPASP